MMREQIKFFRVVLGPNVKFVKQVQVYYPKECYDRGTVHSASVIIQSSGIVGQWL